MNFNLQLFATGTTTTTQMVIPQVWADMISAGLPSAIKFTPFAAIDDKLVGTPGNTVTIPSWAYIGDAKDVEEGADIEVTQMASSTKQMTIKKAGKAIDVTDEAILSGLGDPFGEGQRQLTMAIASKLEEDVITALEGATLTLDKALVTISYDGIVEAVDKLAEESDTEKFIFVHPTQITALRKDVNFIDKTKYGNDVMMTGEIGMVAGCRVIVSKRVRKVGETYQNYVVCMTSTQDNGSPALPPVTIYVKRGATVEADRDILAAKTVVAATQHYGVGLTNDSKVVKVTFKA